MKSGGWRLDSRTPNAEGANHLWRLDRPGTYWVHLNSPVPLAADGRCIVGVCQPGKPRLTRPPPLL